MQSPIALMQRASYPRIPSPIGHIDSFARMGLGRFGGAGLTAGITGVKSGVSAAGITGTIGAGVASAIGAGAAAGSVVPIIGTAIGVIVALVASGVFSHRVDPEVGNFNNAMAVARSQGAQAVLGIQDKYLVLAGLFDLEPGQVKGNIPIYKKYGRMGEQRFVMDMCALIQSAANQGIITANDTVQSVYDKVVAPWMSGWGLGPMQDSNSQMITYIILGLIGEYVSGQYKQRWYARGGDFAFNSLPAFTLPVAAAFSPGPSGTPTPGAAPMPPPVTAAPQVPQVPQSGVAVPAGFTLVGPDAIGGTPVYVGPDGRYYSWNGVQMSPANTTILLNGQLTGLSNGYVQTGSSPGTSSGGFLPYQLQGPPYQPPAGVTPYVPYTPPSAPVPTLATASLGGSGLPSWAGWGAVGGVVLLMLATARPMKQPRMPARRRSR